VIQSFFLTTSQPLGPSTISELFYSNILPFVSCRAGKGSFFRDSSRTFSIIARCGRIEFSGTCRAPPASFHGRRSELCSDKWSFSMRMLAIIPNSAKDRRHANQGSCMRNIFAGFACPVWIAFGVRRADWIRTGGNLLSYGLGISRRYTQFGASGRHLQIARRLRLSMAPDEAEPFKTAAG
jgi:hypothetical protein